MKVKISIKPFFLGISLFLSRLSCDTDGWQNLMAATSRPLKMVAISTWGSSLVLLTSVVPPDLHWLSLAFFVFSLLPSSIHYCPHKWLLSEISYYDTLSLHSMSICFWTSVIKSRVLHSETIHHPSINPSIQLATLSFCRRSQRSQNNPSKRHVPLAVLYHKSVLGKIIEL